MKPIHFRMLAIGIVGIGFGTFAIGQPATVQDNRRVAAQNDILNLGDNLNSKTTEARARQIVLDHDSCDISSVFKTKTKGGLGIGKLTEVESSPDNIDRFMNKLARRRTITEAEIEKYSADYVRVAKVMQAMAELAPYRAPEQVKKNEKRAKEWVEVSAEFKEGATTFRTAIDERDPKKLRTAAVKMVNTCCHCHELLD